MADDSIISYSDLIGDDGTFDEILKNIKKIEKELISSAKKIKKEFSITNPNDVQRIQQLEKEVRELAQANKNLAKATETVNKAKKKSAELTKEQLIQQEALKLERREAARIAKQQAIILKEEGNTIKSLRAQLSLVTIQWSKLTAQELKNTKEGKNLVKTKKELTAQLKKLEKQTGDNRRNVGNYTSALSSLDAAFIGLGGNVGITVGAFKSLGTAIRGTARSMGVLKTAIAASGIGALVVAFGTLATFLKRTTEGADKLSQLFAGIGATINVLLDRIAALGSAIVKVFQGDFAGAAEVAKKAVTGVFTEIKKETKEASQAAKDLNAIYEEETELLLKNGKKRLQIAELERKAEENKKKDKKAAEAQLKEAIKLTNEIFNSELEIDKKRLKIAKDEEKRSNSLKEDRREIVNATNAIAEKEAQREGIIRGLTRKLNSLTASEEANEKALQMRIKAIEMLSKEVARLEVENKEESIQKSLELEQLRYKEEKALKEAQFKDFEIFFAGNQEKLTEISDLRRRYEEQAEKEHQANLKEITEEFEIAPIRIKSIESYKDAQKEAEEELRADIQKTIDLELNRAKVQERLDQEALERQKKQKEASKETLKQIGETAEKIGQEIVNLLEKQADVAEENVNNQVDNLERARERAANGLEANLAFEEAELSRRQAEQQQKQKQAEQAAKLLALFNLVSAYAQSGDENALFRGLADFAILEAFGAGLQGSSFYEGTEDTGTTLTPLDNKGGRLAILHDNERVMTKAQNMLLNGMSNEQVVQNAILGEQMGDYFNPQSISTVSQFQKQKDDFVKSMQGGASVQNNNSEMVKHLKRIEAQLANQPNFSLELEKLYEGVYGMVKQEIKTNFKKINRYKLRGRL